MTALLPLQAALVTALKAHAPLMAVVTGVHDGAAPDGAALPYIVVGSATEARVGILGRGGWSDTITVHVWSDYAGRKEALEIVGLMDDAVAGGITVADHDHTRIRREFAEVLMDPDGLRHVPVRYRMMAVEAS